MATPETKSDITLRVERTYQAPRERVFKAWTEAESLKRWFAPSDEFTTEVMQLEPEVGGGFRIRMTHSGGKVHTAFGVYREVTPPSRLVFTWRWESDAEAAATVVTVEFHDRGAETHLVLTHTGFSDAASRDSHEHGWTGIAERLARAFA